VFSEEPPLCVVSFNRRADGQMKHTLKNIRRTGEFVVNLADESTAEAMHISSYEIPEEQSEFEKTGLTPAPALLVRHPRIAEAAASLECKVERRIEFGAEREVVIGEILLVHAREGVIDPATKRVSEAHYKPVGRLFASRYCTTRQRFNLPGPLPD
jgi:flavin reductase (DIM6/NTAB) family NADH-FMN oxidoreductase RutF